MNTLSVSKHCNEINMVEVMFKFNQLITYNDKKVKVDITIYLRAGYQTTLLTTVKFLYKNHNCWFFYRD